MELEVRRLDDDSVPIDVGDGCRGRAVIWPGMGARHRSMHYLEIPAGESSRSFVHKESEAVYLVKQGRGRFVDLDTGESHPVKADRMVYLEAGTRYRMEADDSMVCIGGPCPPDDTLYD